MEAAREALPNGAESWAVRPGGGRAIISALSERLHHAQQLDGEVGGVPFFTTKSRGSGLGLPTVKRLIDAHSGDIAIDCPTGGGTIVVVRLPLISPPSSRGEEASA